MRKLAKAISTVAQEIFQSQQASPATHKTHAMSAVVGALAAYRLPIPSSEVRSPKEWYIVNCLSSAEEFIGAINEYSVMDVKGALDVAKAVWESRYSVVHVPASKEAVACLMSIVGSGNYRVPEVYSEAIMVCGSANFQELMVVANELCKGDMALETPEA